MNKDTKFRVEKRKTETEGRDKRNSRANVHRVLDGVVERKRGSRVIKKRKKMGGGYQTCGTLEPCAFRSASLGGMCERRKRSLYDNTRTVIIPIQTARRNNKLSGQIHTAVNLSWPKLKNTDASAHVT